MALRIVDCLWEERNIVMQFVDLGIPLSLLVTAPEEKSAKLLWLRA
jgi:hypothetical protein